jgi:hypothetical protein
MQKKKQKERKRKEKNPSHNSKNDEGPPPGSCNMIDDFNPLPVEPPTAPLLPFFNLRPSTTMGKKLRPRNVGLPPPPPPIDREPRGVAGESGDASEGGGGGAGSGEVANEVKDDKGIEEEVVFGFSRAEVELSPPPPPPPPPPPLPLNNEAGI